MAILTESVFFLVQGHVPNLVCFFCIETHNRDDGVVGTTSVKDPDWVAESPPFWDTLIDVDSDTDL